MDGFRSHFQTRHVILPVIHVESERQALRNAALARDAGADGVFLINHGLAVDKLLAIHRLVAAEQADWWVGLNCLGVYPVQVFDLFDRSVAGAWVDNACINEHADDQHDADQIREARARSGWQGLYFGGVAFKYQRKVTDVGLAAKIASRYMDVVTTSGPGTGSAASVDKIKQMKISLGDAPLAIASGITPDNVADYLSWSDCFLVASGISSSFTELDSELVRRLVTRVRSF